MSFTQPLFTTDRRSSTHSDERATEEDALLGDQQKKSQIGQTRGAFWREFGLFVWAALATAAVIVLGVLFQHQSATRDNNTKPAGKRNLIFMVSDGMGPASLSLTRSFRQYRDSLPIDDILVLDQHFIGSSRTRSSSSLVTDSAAGATAFSCGKKSYNGAISILPDHTPCGTVLEAAKKAGYMTGLVVTTSITDATPACFASHANLRTEEDLIAQQEIGDHPLGRVLDLMLGGGRCHFLPNNSSGGCRADDLDLTDLAQKKYNWTYIDSRRQYDDITSSGDTIKLPLMGLFADRDIPFEIDRRNMTNIYPSLDEMARTALKALEVATQDSDKGFFLMIEGSRIDHAGHWNDPAAQVNEVLAYDKAFASVVEFLERSSDDGVLVATSDHETGGLAVARQLNEDYPEYLWYPEVLDRVSHSGEYLTKQLYSHLHSKSSETKDELRKYILEELVEKGLGISDASEEEIQLFIDKPLGALYFFAGMVSRRAQIGWSTHGHSAVDVNIYGTAGSQDLRGNNENTDIGKFLRHFLEVDVDEVTKELVEASKPSIRTNNDASWLVF
ncbi:alkaline phosphatase [Bisporella sp. PMI_857]|nr:alkaline phosphatase [Bisporella sp. PMI_857]